MRVFVYGTLMRGGTYHRLLGDSLLLARCHTAPRYTLLDLGDYPALLAGGTTAVAGEIYEVSDDLLPTLDDLEGHPSYYRRDRVELEDGRLVTSYLFVNTEAATGARVLSSGRWRHKASR